jgi:uncharacterized protein
MPRWILILAATPALLYVGLCALIFVLQRSLIYYPQPRSAAARTETMTLELEQARVLVTTSPNDGPEAVIYFGGNAEDVSQSLPGLKAAFPDRALYLLHYRGYGGSTGKPSESALIADALSLFDRAHAKHPNIYVVGRSLGSGIAIHLASLRPVERLALVTPFSSLQEIAAKQFPLIPVRWLLLDKFESWRYAAAVTAPTTIIAAEYDEVIPRASTEALYAHFRQGLAMLTIIRGVGHNTIEESPDYVPLLNGAPATGVAR